ncbi:MAG: chorismate-binding protein [Mycobacterium sp.]|nr:chorismate-binding protein [Mycobacterium sp.]
MRIERLGELGSAPGVLRALAAGARSHRLAPPAALIGEWFGSAAVIAPSVDIRPVLATEVFDVPPGGPGDTVGGGWIGYLSYPDPGADGAGPRIPPAAGGWTDDVVRLDADGCWWYENLTGAAPPQWLTAALAVPVYPVAAGIDWGRADFDQHQGGVEDCLEAIRAGEIYQACVCTQFTGTLTGTPLDFFTDAVCRLAPARGAYLAGRWGAVASLSPENIMIVDLVRNDLGHVAVTGSVTVSELLAVRPAPGVWHLVSTVAARIPADVSNATLLDATFPPASVTGTPKLRARQLLSEWEPHGRGVYCGTIGLASPVAGCELNVAIRTVEFDARLRAVLGVGGGITADSDPAAEWQECMDKAAPIIGAVPAHDSRDRSTAS